MLAAVLASSTPGCATLLTAGLTGGNADAMRAASAIDAAFFEAVTGNLGSGVEGEGQGDEVPVHFADSEVWICRLDGDEVQVIHAHSVEGARAACLMGNDVDLVPYGCDCSRR